MKKLNWEGLDALIEKHNIPVSHIDTKNAYYGFATPEGIFISDNIRDEKQRMFVTLHEMGHYLSFNKGNTFITNNFLTAYLEDINEECILEETKADRYAGYMFMRLNGFPVSRGWTRRMSDPHTVERIVEGFEDFLIDMRKKIGDEKITYHEMFLNYVM